MAVSMHVAYVTASPRHGAATPIGRVEVRGGVSVGPHVLPVLPLSAEEKGDLVLLSDNTTHSDAPVGRVYVTIARVLPATPVVLHNKGGKKFKANEKFLTATLDKMLHSHHFEVRLCTCTVCAHVHCVGRTRVYIHIFYVTLVYSTHTRLSCRRRT